MAGSIERSSSKSLSEQSHNPWERCSFRAMGRRVKRFPLLLTFSLVGTISGWSQAHNQFEVDATAGYRLGGGSDVMTGGQKGWIGFDGAPSYGGIFGYRLQPDGFIFLSYSRQQAALTYTADAGGSATSGVSVEYLHFGGNLETTRGLLTPYLGISVGATRFADLSGQSGDQQWFFSAALDGGVKFEVHEFVHLRLLGRLPFTVLSSDATVLCPGGGCVVDPDGQPMVQVELQGGIGVSF